METATNALKLWLANGAYTGEKLAGQAKIKIAEARAIALKAHTGRIVDEELEREPGGSGLRYFLILSAVKLRKKSVLTRRLGRSWKIKRKGAILTNIAFFGAADCHYS